MTACDTVGVMSTVVARLGKPHGIRGEMTVEVRTDDPDERFVPEAVFGTEPDIGPLTLTRARWHRDRLLLSFAEVPDRNRAEEIRNTLITVDAEDTDDDDEDAWYIDDLIGADAHIGEHLVGKVSGVSPGAAQDLLHITPSAEQVERSDSDEEILVPFVAEIVPEVDIDAGRIVLTPPAGLIPGFDD